ncbi:hypothetical protein ACA910_019883 [Epithemia clementina (nom. ined.)]
MRSTNTEAINLDDEQLTWARPESPQHAHFDCFSGAAGDMILAACLDAAGSKSDALLRHVELCIRKGMPALNGEFSISKKKVWRGVGRIAATHVVVKSLYKHEPAPVPRLRERRKPELDNAQHMPTPTRVSRKLSSSEGKQKQSTTRNDNGRGAGGLNDSKGSLIGLDDLKESLVGLNDSKELSGGMNDSKGSLGGLNDSKGSILATTESQEQPSGNDGHSHEHHSHGQSEQAKLSPSFAGSEDKHSVQPPRVGTSTLINNGGSNDRINSIDDSHEPTHDHNHSHSHSHNHSHFHNHESTDSKGPLRNLPEIRHMLEEAPEQWIPLWVRTTAIEAFTALAEAEAKVHGAESMDAVHFHEVGAVDSIVDTVGSLLALHALGAESFSCSRLPLGEGTVRTAHGLLPVPVPATLRLMIGMPTTAGPPGVSGELVTPTGAALLRTLTMKAKQTTGIGGHAPQPMQRPPQFTLRKVGVGAGTKDFGNHPNILRLLLGDAMVE